MRTCERTQLFVLLPSGIVVHKKASQSRRIGTVASRSRPIRHFALLISLFALWLLMSGVYKPLIVIFGALSSMLCVWIVYKLELTRIDHNLKLRPIALIKYLIWLTVEIGKADWAVTKVILSPKSLKRQRLIGVPANQSSDFGKMLFANSITITPGTVTVETETEQFIVHALTDEAADLQALDHMGSRVCAVEGIQKGSNV